MESARNSGAERVSTLRPPKTPDRARETMLRYFASESTRGQIPLDLVRRLDQIKGVGVRSFQSLKPYRTASVFVLDFSDGTAKESSKDNVGQLAATVSGSIRDQLDDASEQLMARMFITYPETNDSDLETTYTISAMFFLAAVARYGPELILESLGEAKEKAELADQFIQFYDREIIRFMESDGTQWTHARKYHASVLGVYEQFKSEMPDLFRQLQQKLGFAGEFVTPYGQMVSFNWANYCYGDL
jgi:hypothetical protein